MGKLTTRINDHSSQASLILAVAMAFSSTFSYGRAIVAGDLMRGNERPGPPSSAAYENMSKK